MAKSDEEVKRFKELCREFTGVFHLQNWEEAMPAISFVLANCIVGIAEAKRLDPMKLLDNVNAHIKMGISVIQKGEEAVNGKNNGG